MMLIIKILAQLVTFGIAFIIAILDYKVFAFSLRAK